MLMLNYLWAGMLLLGIMYAALTGNISAVTEAALNGAGDAISLCITMAGVMALWMGLMEIGRQAGLMERLTGLLEPFLRFLFPRIPKGHPAKEYIAVNLIANILGLGWACTPAGLKAMEALAQLEAERGNPQYLPQSRDAAASVEAPVRTASNEMCIFLILNVSSLQLIPVNMIAYRTQYNSTQPAAIVAPALFATAVSTVAAVIFCKLMDIRRRKPSSPFPEDWRQMNS